MTSLTTQLPGDIPTVWTVAALLTLAEVLEKYKVDEVAEFARVITEPTPPAPTP